MFAYLEGKITYKSPSLLFVEVTGVGYEVNITLQTYSKIQAAEHCKLFIHLQIKEDAWVLYGFATEQERQTFRQLLGINGVGAAIARIILSSLTPEELEKVVAYEDVKALEKVKGIGAKTAQRIILELKGKVSFSKDSEASLAVMHNTSVDDALIALINLGINRANAESAIKKVTNADSLTIQELIKQALKAL